MPPVREMASLSASAVALNEASALVSGDALVVVVRAVQHVDVERDARVGSKAVEDVRDHLAAQVANLFAHKVQVRVAVRARREVDDRARERLVEWRMAGAEAAHAADLAERLAECLAKRNRAVLRRMVVVNPEVATALELERHAAVLRERAEHLVSRDVHGRGSRCRSSR